MKREEVSQQKSFDEFPDVSVSVNPFHAVSEQERFSSTRLLVVYIFIQQYFQYENKTNIYISTVLSKIWGNYLVSNLLFLRATIACVC